MVSATGIIACLLLGQPAAKHETYTIKRGVTDNLVLYMTEDESTVSSVTTGNMAIQKTKTDKKCVYKVTVKKQKDESHLMVIEFVSVAIGYADDDDKIEMNAIEIPDGCSIHVGLSKTFEIKSTSLEVPKDSKKATFNHAEIASLVVNCMFHSLPVKEMKIDDKWEKVSASTLNGGNLELKASGKLHKQKDGLLEFVADITYHWQTKKEGDDSVNTQKLAYDELQGGASDAVIIYDTKSDRVSSIKAKYVVTGDLVRVANPMNKKYTLNHTIQSSITFTTDKPDTK